MIVAVSSLEETATSRIQVDLNETQIARLGGLVCV